MACLVKGLQGSGNTSKISIDKIVNYSQYRDQNGKNYVFGRKAVEAAINRLAQANKIKINKPAVKGKCTTYTINEIEHFEKLSEEFFNLNLPPLVKGYILCGLQYNLNRDENTFEPNDLKTKTTYNIMELSKKYNMPISSIYKAEKILKENGSFSITNDPNNYRDKETGLILQNRSIDLDKVGLGKFVINKLVEHEERLNNTYTKEEVDALIADALKQRIIPSNVKEVSYKKCDI